MKKILSLILCVFLISGCSKASTNHIKKDLSLSGINEITYEQLQDKLDSDELFYILEDLTVGIVENLNQF